MFIFLVAVGGAGGLGGVESRPVDRGGGRSLQKRSFYGPKMGPKSWCGFSRVRPR